MEIRVFDTKAEMARAAADRAGRAVADAIARDGRAHVIAATGASQFEFLEALTSMPGIEWSKTVFFHLDEYVGLEETHPASFRRYLKERIVARVEPAAFHFIEGDAPDPGAEARRVGEELRPEASWPEGAEPLAARPASSVEEEVVTGVSMSEPVRNRGELLGALTIEKRPGENLSATEEKLVSDLASQAGLVMRNAGLTEELMDSIAQLRTSRQRLVTAQDEERRKLERNLHDGAQQQIVALTMKLGLLERLVERDPAQARSIAGQLQQDATEALEELRDLARGIYPPLLADRGLIAALQSQARKSAVPVTVKGDGIGRYAREAEAAVYFSCLEALQNVLKYASASRATVSLSDGEGALRFNVTDDGVGFDTTTSSYGTGLQGIADRLAALDGSIEVRSTAGVGTTVEGILPVGDKTGA